MKHRAGNVSVRGHGTTSVLDAPTIVFERAGTRREHPSRRKLSLIGGALALGSAGLIGALVPSVAPAAPTSDLSTITPAPIAVAPIAPTTPAVAASAASVPAADAGTGSANNIGSLEAGSPPVDGLPVPGGVVGLTTNDAMDRYRDAGLRNVEFRNTSDNNVLVPSDIYRVVSAPAAGEIVDPDISFTVWATEVSTVATPEERAASDRADAAWERRQQAYEACGLYRLDGIHSSEVADCIERRTS